MKKKNKKHDNLSWKTKRADMMIVKCSTKAKNRTHNSNKKHIHTKKKQIENVFKAQPIDK